MRCPRSVRLTTVSASARQSGLRDNHKRKDEGDNSFVHDGLRECAMSISCAGIARVCASGVFPREQSGRAIDHKLWIEAASSTYQESTTVNLVPAYQEK
jgi:hypothetical protein